MKYFNFLLENDITFKLDETGNYTALVKVFNPEHFKQKENERNNIDKNNFYSEGIKTKSDIRHIRSNSAGKPNQLTNEELKIKEKKLKKVNFIFFSLFF